MGLGLTYLTGTDDILAGAVAQKSIFLGPRKSAVELKLKAQADYNTQTQQVTPHLAGSCSTCWQTLQRCECSGSFA